MEDYLVSSDLCEENGYIRQAEMLRRLAGSGGRLYVVAMRGDEYNDEYYSVTDLYDTPRTLYLDREEAERTAALLNAQRLQQINLSRYGNSTEAYTSLPEAELNRQASAILGTEFRLWIDNYHNPNPFPDSATDEQLIEVARLFDRLVFFHVIEVEFAG